MNGEIILVGFSKNADKKLLRIEGAFEEKGEENIDVIYFPDLDVSIGRKLLIDACEFIRKH